MNNQYGGKRAGRNVVEIFGKIKEDQDFTVELKDLIDQVNISLDYVEQHIEQDIRFNMAWNRMNFRLLNKAERSLRDAFPFVFGREEIRDGLRSHFKAQAEFAIYTTLSEADRSGVTTETLRVFYDYLSEFRFSESKEFLDKEVFLLNGFGLGTKEIDVVKILRAADKHKYELPSRLVAMMTTKMSDPDTEVAPMASAFDSATRTKGTQAAGGYLGAVNLAGAVAPEPFISKGIAVASVVTGFLGCLFGD